MSASDTTLADLMDRARFNMVEQQIRPWEVLDTKVLDLLHRVKREDFVPEAHRALAFADLELPIGHGEKMLPPKIDRKSTRLNSSHVSESRMPSSA